MNLSLNDRRRWPPAALRGLLCLGLILSSTWLLCDRAAAQASDGEGLPTAEGVAFFESDVRPLLEDSCFRCHGGRKRVKGGLDLTTRAGLLRGGDRGPAFDAGAPQASLILQMISYKDADHEMPPSGKLADAEAEILHRWVDLGAPYPAELQGDEGDEHVSSEGGIPIDDEARGWWAYRPLKRPEVPDVEARHWVRQPLDAFVLARLEAADLPPNPPADPVALLRRVTYNLTGLPPTPAQIDAFVADPSLKHYERIVDDLLASPRYGERWGRHWLDLVRYAETNGYERDSQKPYAWRYRDYVIRAFNEDRPYDQFIREQLAGDELEEPSVDAIAATGFYRLGLWDDEPADRELARYNVLDGILSTTSEAFLAMTVGCARCHDHKKDPIHQKDYYRMLAFFQDVSPMDKKNITRTVYTPELRELHRERLREKAQHEAALHEEMFRLEQELGFALRELAGADAGSALAPSDLVEVSYRLYRDTWNELPPFDDLRHENEGRIAHDLFTLDPATRQDAIGLVFEGKLRVPQTGRYRFEFDARDGVRLLVDGEEVAKLDGRRRHQETVELSLESGFQPIRLEYFNAQGKPVLNVFWSGPGVSRRALTRPETGPSRVDMRRLIEERGEELLGSRKHARYFELEKELEASRKREVENPGIVCMAVFERGRKPTHVLLRGNPSLKGDPVEPGFPRVIDPRPAQVPDTPRDAASSGKRRVLAEWIASEDNPLTARVLVNRIWQHQFGRGIVPTPNDFGKLGRLPTHPRLLDWLAVEFMEDGWSIKKLQKRILMSATFRMSSQDSQRALRVDPENTLFWRFDMRRLTAEEVRDSILAVNGTLNLKMGGPSIYTKVPWAVLRTASRPHQAWGKSPPEEQRRRSIYIHVKRSLREPILATFDFADTDSSCPVRFATTVPTQALTSINSDFFNEEAALLAGRLRREVGNDLDAQIERGLRLVVGRPARADEVERLANLARELHEEHGLSVEQSLDKVCLVLLNLNEFLYLD